jgi:hypothetical protein
MTVKRKFIWITAFIIIAAIIIVICVTYFTGGQAVEFDGTLVKLNTETIIGNASHICAA